MTYQISGQEFAVRADLAFDALADPDSLAETKKASTVAKPVRRRQVG
jgi:hypothetical protein